jgi:hypothetical protein
MLRWEVGPVSDPGWKKPVYTAERLPKPAPESGLNGIVADQSGAAVPGAWIDVVVKRSGAQTHVLGLPSGQDGKFHAPLPAGEYVIIVSAQGFSLYSAPIVIAPAAASSELKVVLVVGSET